VYLVEHVDLKTRHAIKVLAPHQSKHPQIAQRFRNEARAAAIARSPNIVAVRDFGQLDDGCWYLVMDYWEGSTLSEFLASRGSLSHELVIRIAADALNGLAAAHRRNIIHRDIKPDNLYLAQVDDDLRAMILDFGVCRLGDDPGVVTRNGLVLGTPRYMAPEQFRGEAIDHRADLWALGAILYEMATGGWLPYDADGVPKGQVLDDTALSARMAHPAVDPQRRNPGITRALADAILRLLDPDPAKRPSSASDCASLLAETLPGDGHEPSGLDIVNERAPELVRRTRDSLRSPVPVVVARDLASRYVIRSRIGGGAMAEVFRADALGAEGFARPVALKRVLAGYSEVPAFAAMFCEEARIASQLSHPNVVPVLDGGRDAAGRLFLVMEYVGGKDLGAILATGRLPPAVAIFVISEALRGLEYAHELPDPSDAARGLVHRDISPRNVLVSWEGAVKVSDFGIAKALGSGAGSGSIAGRPAYLAPEQVQGAPLDGRSDLFSVGVVLWEALTGTPLFQGEGAMEICAQILFRDAPLPSAVRSGIPADLEAVTMKLLARDPGARYATAERAIEELARCADHPRNGRSDLMRLLAGRFPAEAGPRSRGPTKSEHPSGSRDTAELRMTPRQSTLDAAASQWAPPLSVRTDRRRWLVGAIAGVAVSVGTFAVVAVARSSSNIATASEVEPGTRPDAARPFAVGAGGHPCSPAPDPVQAPRPASQAPFDTGALTINVTPFAQVWIDDESVSAGQTPLQLRLGVGPHRIRLINAGLHKDTTVPVTITTKRAAAIDETW
jgi:serine/threonine protein kinase